MRWSLATTAAVLTACANTSTPTGFCVEQAKAMCDLQYDCCTAAERRHFLFTTAAGHDPAHSTKDECVASYTHLCEAYMPPIEEAVTEENLEYDGDEASDCIESLHEAVADCDAADFFDAAGTFLVFLAGTGKPGVLGDDCEDAFDAQQDEGDSCFTDFECSEGACVFDAGDADEPTVDDEGECTGTDEHVNPLESHVDFEICEGPDDALPF